mgnify:CR=1 FL=1
MNKPDQPREYPSHSVFEHHILLAFNDDLDAERFDDWWNNEGWDAFQKWAAIQEEKHE